MKAKSNLGILRNNKGQNLVEFALVVPLLLAVLIGIAEFGRAWMARNILTGAAREAARMAVVPPPPGSDRASWDIAIRQRARDILTSAGIDSTRAVVQVDDTGVFGEVSVTVTYQFPLVVAGFIPGLSNPEIPLSSVTSMRREY